MEVNILPCHKCGFKTRILRRYVLHYKKHCHVPNLVYPCGVLGCCKQFRSFGTFNVHVSRQHADLRYGSVSKRERAIAGMLLRYGVAHCHAVCDDVKKLISHLKDHVQSLTAVKCPFKNCTKLFENVTVSTFKSHISRCQQKSGGSINADWYTSPREGISGCSVAMVEHCVEDNCDLNSTYVTRSFIDEVDAADQH